MLVIGLNVTIQDMAGWSEGGTSDRLVNLINSFFTSNQRKNTMEFFRKTNILEKKEFL